jgi:phosphoglycolate phosphatase
VALKPDPVQRLLCLDRLKLSTIRCLFVGDSQVDAETAAAAGVPFALFAGGYGLGFGEPDPGTLPFSTFAELADVLN